MVEKRGTHGILAHVVMVLGVLIVAFPLYLAFVASTHTAQEIVQAPMPLLPGGHMWDSYKAALFGRETSAGSNAPVIHMMWVSFVTAMVCCVLSDFSVCQGPGSVWYFRASRSWICGVKEPSKTA